MGRIDGVGDPNRVLKPDPYHPTLTALKPLSSSHCDTCVAALQQR